MASIVDVDRAAGIGAVMHHLRGQGHERIAYLGSPLNTTYAIDRYRGFCQSLTEYQVKVNDDLVVHALQQPQEVTAAVDRLLRLPGREQPTAIVTDGDRLAAAVLAALEERRSVVGPGGQIAVTGFDDLAFAGYQRPPLTTVRQPIVAACETLLSLLVPKFNSKQAQTAFASGEGIVQVGPEQVLLEPELVIRGSA